MGDWIVRLDNILPSNSRRILVKESKSLLMEGEVAARCPGINYGTIFSGKQTLSNLHEVDTFTEVHTTLLDILRNKLTINYSIQGSWVSQLSRDSVWYSSDYGDILIYYMNSFYDSLDFKDQKKISVKKNSLYLFPAHLTHRPFLSKFPFKRYALKMILRRV